MSNHTQRAGSLRAAAALLFVLIVGSTVAAIQWPGVGPAQAGWAASDAAATLGPDYGVVFISSAEDRLPGSGRNPASLERQYQNGLSTGATWNRWPLYWFNIEQSPDSFNWAAQDATVAADLVHGLKLNAILLGTPGFYTTSREDWRSRQPEPRAGTLELRGAEKATPAGLYLKVFSDGTDVPGPGKSINPANKWARFVSLAVDRYKPGGVLAQAAGWPAGVGVTHWEMWNEPDLLGFWDGSLQDYARLLKVGYLAAKHADPNAVVLFAGLANHGPLQGYYRDVLTIYAVDPDAAASSFYHDILATHSYFHAWKSWYHVYRALGTMRDFGFEKPIWLNETGVPAWNDYPGPVWDSQSALRATKSEQADYTIQTAFYATFAGADAIFHFQLYDGCGNQPQGTNFPPHNGELCDANNQFLGKPCAGDANGLFSNPSDAACFTQHPRPETARENFAAFKVLTTYLQGVEPYWRQRPGEAGVCPMQTTTGGVYMTPPQEWIAFYQPTTGRRIVGMWTLCGRRETAVIDATDPAGTAQLVYPDGRVETITAVNGRYTIELPPATNDNPFGSEGVNGIYPIGGRPVILIERDDRTPPPTPTPTPSPTPTRPPNLFEKGFMPLVTTGP